VPATLAVCVWAAFLSVAPAVLAGAFVVADDLVWRRRGKPWHDPLVIVLLLPALVCALWIGLRVEAAPGLALTGLVCTLISYHGRHRP